MLCIATSGYAALSAPYFLTVDADLADFDPRPAVRRALEPGAPGLAGAVRAGPQVAVRSPRGLPDVGSGHRPVRRVPGAGSRWNDVLLHPLPQRRRPARERGPVMASHDHDKPSEFEPGCPAC